MFRFCPSPFRFVAALAVAVGSGAALAAGQEYRPLVIDDDGANVRTILLVGAPGRIIPVATRLAGCTPVSTVTEPRSDGGVLRRQTLRAPDGHVFTLEDGFTPSPSGFRWEIAIRDDAPPWSTSIETEVRYPGGAATRWWTAWGNPLGLSSAAPQDTEEIANAIFTHAVDLAQDWNDPLVPQPLRDSLYYYGAPPYEYDRPRTGFCPFQGDLFALPLVTMLEPAAGSGLTVALSPEDLLLDLTLATGTDGSVVFRRLHHRLGGGRTVRFALDLVAHAGDWRAALGWMTARYPAFFDPVLPLADEIAGTGAYTRNWADFDVEKMKRMAFRLNWKASHDFPYMGMFLPPVPPDREWTGFWRKPDEPRITLRRLADYSATMRGHGFHVLSYFNVTEFGTDIQYPAPPRSTANDADLWQNANDFLHTRLVAAILLTPPHQKPYTSKTYGRTEPGNPFWTWGKGIVLDPGEPVYQEFLLGMARRHLAEIPDASGICIDRMDWIRMYNHRRDDGVSWFEGAPVRSLYVSWMDLMARLGPVFHDAGRVVYANNHLKRLEQLRHIDGLFDEFTYAGSPLNTTALLGVRKPVMGWISDERQFQPDPDRAMQKFLYLGVFPMCPFPANDHSLRPSPAIDRLYLDYGPLLERLRGKKWVLTAGAVEVTGGDAKANLFAVPGGWVVPVTHGAQPTATLTLREPALAAASPELTALHPGVAAPIPLAARREGDTLVFTVPLHRGCALVSLRRPAAS